MWLMTERDKVAIVERRVCADGVECDKIWKRGTKLEIHGIFKEPDIVKFIAILRLKWTGHLIIWDDDRVTKIFVTRPYGIRKRGRPKLVDR
ncbi:hypothetical protein TNCV_2623441 [Trichonephila clavipes]|nr:hypothetical protein TNCV_2623441 [Trichonephila clavipes]